MTKKAHRVNQHSVHQHLTILLILVICFISSLTPAAVFAAESDSEDVSVQYYINDVAGLMTMEEDLALEEKAAALSDQYACGIYILTIDDAMQGSDDIFDYAEWFYFAYGLGMGEDNSGVLLVINAEGREYATYFYGKTADYAFDSHGQEMLESYFLSDLHNDRWQKAMEGFVRGCGVFLKNAAEGHPVRRSHTLPIVICVAGSFLIAWIICSALRSKMKSVHIGTSARSYVMGGIQLTGQYDRFKYREERRTKIEKGHGSESSSSSRTGSRGGSGRSGSF